MNIKNRLLATMAVVTMLLSGCTNDNNLKLDTNLFAINRLINVNITNESNSRNSTARDISGRIREPDFFTTTN